MSECKTVTLRTRPLKKGMLSFYLDYYPGYRDQETMKTIRHEGLNIYIYAFNKQSSSLANKADRLMPVFNYINNHYKEPIPLETLANTITVTPQHLCHIFKSFTGRTVTEYINSVRIGKSKELLLSGRNLLIKEIAAECGFTDVSYFCETFRRSEGISPAVFRERG